MKQIKVVKCKIKMGIKVVGSTEKYRQNLTKNVMKKHISIQMDNWYTKQKKDFDLSLISIIMSSNKTSTSDIVNGVHVSLLQKSKVFY